MRLGEKIGYGLGDTASSMLWKLFSVYLMFFYTDICGIDAWVVGVLFLVTRIWDSLLDPVVGLLCDRTSSRWGTFRPWLLWGALPFGALGVLTFYMPEWGTGGKVVYATVTYSLMMIVYSSVNVPYAALLGVMSADPHERTVLAAFRMAFAAAGSMVVVLAVEALVKAFRPWAGSSGSWIAAIAVVAVVAVLLFFVTFATTRERIRPVRTERHPVLGSLRDLLHNKPWLILAGAAVCLQVFNAFRESGTIYFFKYCVAGETVGTMSFAGVALTGSALFLAVGQLFNIAGIQKSLECGFSFWVAIIMGCITGAAGGVIRDVLLNEEPVIFRKEIYAMACVAGGLAYWGLSYLGVSLYITVIVAFCVVCAIRLLAVRYHISLPKLRDEEQTVE